ncbi:MFS transporter [Salinicola rhizosphaerae]|uniref:MFS transporter n=1 Tax=Salinicola rhizosphaerae TaxID=1443141 RepID=A0ABQ3DNQ4_9GAMM|nr:MFS transporter [Salinicola rhizosphaerae]GHB07380.1 MFS transporter [Salinicola rhizosphaerae]
MPIVVLAIAEWFGTALWFTPNAVIDDLQRLWSLAPGDIGWLTGAVQLGFLLGTLTIGLSGLADRIDAARLFTVACLIGALSNALLPFAGGLETASALRMMTGLALAGIYPIGMKLMVGWAPGRAGLGLSWLVGMLVLGTAMPHLLAALADIGVTQGASPATDWRSTLWLASLLALLGGAGVWRLGEAPRNRGAARPHNASTSGLRAFGIADFRRAAGAYFGHMWELYTLWAALPLLLGSAVESLSPRALALTSFGLIAIGAPGCWLGGWCSQHLGSRAVAQAGLIGSVVCAALYPLLAPQLAPAWLIALLASWSLFAVIDSPHFSALSAKACPPPLLGSALTLQNAIGFGISALSVALLLPLLPSLGPWLGWCLLPGPLLALLALKAPRSRRSCPLRSRPRGSRPR